MIYIYIILVSLIVVAEQIYFNIFHDRIVFSIFSLLSVFSLAFAFRNLICEGYGHEYLNVVLAVVTMFVFIKALLTSVIKKHKSKNGIGDIK